MVEGDLAAPTGSPPLCGMLKYHTIVYGCLQGIFCGFPGKSAAFSPYCPGSAPAAALFILLPPLEGLVDEDDIVPEPLHAVPRDAEILPPAEQAEEAAGAEHDEGLDLSLRDLQLQIPHEAQPPPVADIDDLLAPQVRKSFHHAVPPRNQPMLHRAGPMPAFLPDTGFLSSPPAAAPGKRRSPP